MELGFIVKGSNGVARLTEKGRTTAARLSRYRDAVEKMPRHSFPEAVDLEGTVCYMLSEIPKRVWNGSEQGRRQHCMAAHRVRD